MNARYLALVGLLAGCALDPTPSLTPDDNELVNVPQTDVDRQSIGSSWLYAHASWVSSLHRAGTGEELAVSVAYWSYWHWFEQIAYGFSPSIAIGGNWATANCIVRKYGLVPAKDFVGGSESELAARQETALRAMRESLERGTLSDPGRRRDKKVLREELDRAWALSEGERALLDRVFGADVSKTFVGSASSEGSPIVRPQDFSVAYASGHGQPSVAKTLAKAAVEWQQIFYVPTARQRLLERIDFALRDQQSIVVTWFVDFNAMERREGERRGAFSLATLRELGPGRQGGHTTVLEGYEADRFLRVRGTWGSVKPAPIAAAGTPAHNDLYFDYLDGPIKRCIERNGETDTSNCPFDQRPLQNVVLPPGY